MHKINQQVRIFMDTFLLYIMKLMACTSYQQEIDPGSLCSVFSLVDAHLLYEIIRCTLARFSFQH
jgi:hypothetical protein